MVAQTVISMQVLCRCPQCRGVNRFVLDWNNPRKYSRCQVCGEVIPTGAFKVLATNNDFRHPIF